MAMTAGTVTIDGSGNPSGAGMARAIFDSWIATFDFGGLSGATLQSAKQRIADLCNALAVGVVDHIVANAEVTVTVDSSDAGLQRTPNPNNPDTDTQGPSAPVVLATKGTVA